MDFPVELVGILKHAGADGKLFWIKAEKRIAIIGKVTNQAPKKKYISPSTRKRNTQRLNQWKAKRNGAVEDTRVNPQTKTENYTT
jgi:hypothetical protein